MTSFVARDVSGVPVRDLLELNGRTAVVTGGARGIGRAISERFAEAGARVVVSDIDKEQVVRTADEISRRYGADVRPVFTDVSNPAAVDALADVADGVGEGLAIWVNNAGVYPATPVTQIDEREWRRTMAITLDGAFYGCRAAAQRMSARQELPGRVIVNMSSLSGLRGRRNLASYVAAKHGVTGLVRALAVELGPVGIRVVGVAPSVVDTPGMEERRQNSRPEDKEKLRQLEASVISEVPLGRVGVVDDVARTTLYLVSDLAEFISGVVLPVDGGVSAS